jgi:hypothetical protein
MSYVSSWPGLSRPSTPFLRVGAKTWMPGTRPGMTIEALLVVRGLVKANPWFGEPLKFSPKTVAIRNKY